MRSIAAFNFTRCDDGPLRDFEQQAWSLGIGLNKYFQRSPCARAALFTSALLVELLGVHGRRNRRVVLGVGGAVYERWACFPRASLCLLRSPRHSASERKSVFSRVDFGVPSSEVERAAGNIARPRSLPCPAASIGRNRAGRKNHSAGRSPSEPEAQLMKHGSGNGAWPPMMLRLVSFAPKGVRSPNH